jgi:ankyrin repeat protein
MPIRTFVFWVVALGLPLAGASLWLWHTVMIGDATPLHLAAWRGDYSTASRCLSDGASTETKCSIPMYHELSGATPLIIAVHRRQSEIAKLLLRHGASVDSTDHYGYTALHHAARVGNVDDGAELIIMKAHLNAKDHGGVTPLMLAAVYGRMGTCKWLIAEGADIHAKDDGGRSASSIAREHGYDELADFLRAME